jgi:hypothetical protein
MHRRELIAGIGASSLLTFVCRANATACLGAVSDPSVSSGRQMEQILEALRILGEPVPAAEAARLLALSEQPGDINDAEIDRILDKRTLIRLQLNQYGIGTSQPGGALRELRELGWRSFLVRVENQARLTGSLILVSRSAVPEGDLQPSIHDSHVLGNDIPEHVQTVPDVDFDLDIDFSQWMGYRFGAEGMTALKGAPVEYQLLQIYSQTGGKHNCLIAAGSAALQPIRRTECKGFAAEFSCSPASTITFDVRDSDGTGSMASLLICDVAGRLYPAPAHRLEPDLGYQKQIYRADGESIRLPAGQYKVIASRGPEYLTSNREVLVPAGGAPASLEINLERWIDPMRLGWYPGDPHLHPEGQAFGIVSKLGLTPETMLRQASGEALSVGSVLIWTGGYYYEKQFLTGIAYKPTYQLPFPDAQRANNASLMPRPTPHDAETVLRYDVEQAAFPSNRFGHPIFLRLKNHDYPGARGIYNWPSWTLPILQWARAQGAVIGFAHCGHGMDVISRELPNYDIPPLDGLGANECLVDVTHGAVDFVGGAEFDPVAELNFWYHLLNCGFRIPMIGETDFPGISRTRRVGTGRTYVGLNVRPRGNPGYEAWAEGIKAGRLYFGDGRSHVMDFRANGLLVGPQALELTRPRRVVISAQVAARLEEVPIDVDSPHSPEYMYWHLERARKGSSRIVSLELVVNGQVAERREFFADGKLRTVSIGIDVVRSSWIAIRILPSVHTAPMVIEVARQPVRVSRRSAQWCRDCIDVLWNKHAGRIREHEREAATMAWNHARDTYQAIFTQCKTD